MNHTPIYIVAVILVFAHLAKGSSHWSNKVKFDSAPDTIWSSGTVFSVDSFNVGFTPSGDTTEMHLFSPPGVLRARDTDGLDNAPSFLIMEFTDLIDDLQFTFAYEPNSWVMAGDNAVLTAFLNDSQVSQATAEAISTVSISLQHSSFNKATFSIEGSGARAGDDPIEIVDNISFRIVPELSGVRLAKFRRGTVSGFESRICPLGLTDKFV